MGTIAPLIDAARAFGTGSLIYIFFVIFGIWAIREIVSLNQLVRKTKSDELASLLKVLKETGADEDVLRRATESAHKQLIDDTISIDPRSYSKKIVLSYVAAFLTTYLRYGAHRGMFGEILRDYSTAGMTYQVSQFLDNGAWFIGLAFIPLLSAISCAIFLNRQDSTRNYLLFGFLLSLLIPIPATVVSLFAL